MKKILIVHGPNLNLLGQRQKSVYGDITLDKVNVLLNDLAGVSDISLDIFQSNHEGDIVDKIGKSKDSKVDGILINPAAYTHTSVAIRDAILAVNLPTVEIHISNIYAREDFRHTSLISPVCNGQVSGFGIDSYLLGLNAIIKIVKDK